MNLLFLFIFFNNIFIISSFLCNSKTLICNINYRKVSPFKMQINGNTRKYNYSLFAYKSTHTIKQIITITSLSLLFPNICFSQIPSMDDYNSGSGTIISKQIPQSNIQLPSKTSSDTIISINNLEELQPILNKISNDINNQYWDDILQTTKNLKLLRKPNFGFRNIQGLREEFYSNRQIDDDSLRQAESLREEIAFSIQELEDFARSHRVIYFNQEDKKLLAYVAEDGKTQNEENVNVIKDSSSDALEYYNSISLVYAKLLEVLHKT